MPRVAWTSVIGAAIILGPALGAGQTGAQSVQYKSPAGVEYRSQPDTDAIKTARTNAKLNQKQIRFVHGDAFPYLRDMQRNERTFDVVILDPPKFIRTREEAEEGRQKYFDLNRLAMQVVAPGGWLVTCTCSGLLPQRDFQQTVAAAVPGNRRARILNRTGAAADHPIAANCLETEYLKCWVYRVL